MTVDAQRERVLHRPLARLAAMLGPAFVASVAYVDPGNVAANLTAGARHRYLLVWVLVASSVMAMIVQYLSAKLGIVTGSSLSSLVGTCLDGRRHGRTWRVLYGGQAPLIAIATDVAEVIGGAIALNLLFGVPLWLGGLIVGLVTLVLLQVLRRRGERVFEVVVTIVLAIVALGFMAGLLWAPPDPGAALAGLVPRFAGGGTVLLAASMLGATVIPHSIYLHSTLAADPYRPDGALTAPVPTLLRYQRLDVVLALLTSGSVNIAMLLFAAAALFGSESTDTIDSAFHVIRLAVGPTSALVFAVGLLASGVGSAVVGTHAGARIIRDLLPWHVPANVRRAVTIIPAVLLLMTQAHPTTMLVVSQLVLSFGIALALVPLVALTARASVMGSHANPRWMTFVGWGVVGLIVALNVTLIVLAIS